MAREVGVLLLAKSFVLVLVALGVRLEVLRNLRLLLLAEKARWTWSPEVLQESVSRRATEHLAAEAPEIVPVLHLVHGRDRRGDEAPRGIPVNVCAHEVLALRHRLELLDVVEFQLSVHRFQASEHDVLSSWAPVHGIALARLERCEVLHLAVDGSRLWICREHGVEVDSRAPAGNLTRRGDDAKSMPLRFPSEAYDTRLLVLQLENLHRTILFGNAEELEARVRALARLCVPINRNAEVRSLWVPVECRLGDGEERLLANVLPRREFHEANTCWRVATSVLLLKQGHDVRGGAPPEVAQSLGSVRLLLAF
mmetsp:Transcript_1256/g.3041  ORF Transcript_1256/g.3041 Transcript_1256/m.3041 type:complete len:311 (+) Transcript_1256:234-1166(+)